MFRGLVSGAALGALILACNGGTTNDQASTGSQTGALGTYRDGCDEAACGAQPAPKHSCVGGYPASVCTKATGTCGWQVDCVAEPAPGYDGNVGLSPCGDATTGEQCGPRPTYDEKDCVYGFIGEPQCERLGSAACAWSRRCGPRPCHETGTCNTLDRSKLAEPCDGTTTCPQGYTCGSISVNVGEYIPPTCYRDGECPLTCAAGKTCYVNESYPTQVGCGGI